MTKYYILLAVSASMLSSCGDGPSNSDQDMAGIGLEEVSGETLEVGAPFPSDESADGDGGASSLTFPQMNAARSARAYLSMKGFSRDGLIEQLSSEYGDGYSVKDATIAVDSLNADWSDNAARSAREYLSMMGFSCQGLVEQLSSDFGDGYTRDQARYGAQQAGAC